MFSSAFKGSFQSDQNLYFPFLLLLFYFSFILSVAELKISTDLLDLVPLKPRELVVEEAANYCEQGDPRPDRGF